MGFAAHVCSPRFRPRWQCTFAAHSVQGQRRLLASALVSPPPPWLLDGQGGCARARVARDKCRTLYCIASSRCSLEAFWCFLKRRHVFALSSTGYATASIGSFFTTTAMVRDFWSSLVSHPDKQKATAPA